MSHLIPGNHRHLTLEDRLYIEESLNESRSFRSIVKFLCKNPATSAIMYAAVLNVNIAFT